MFAFWKSKAPEPLPPPPFDLEQERTARRAAVLAADLEVQDANRIVREFRAAHFAVDGQGNYVPRISHDSSVVPVELLHVQYSKLLAVWSEKVDAHQKALRHWSEIA
jgi:hypothetical protein